MMNEVARNMAGFIHTPGPMLTDIGYMLIPEFESPVLSRIG